MGNLGHPYKMHGAMVTQPSHQEPKFLLYFHSDILSIYLVLDSGNKHHIHIQQETSKKGWWQLPVSHLSGRKPLSQKQCHKQPWTPINRTANPPHAPPRPQESWESEWESGAFTASTVKGGKKEGGE